MRDASMLESWMQLLKSEKRKPSCLNRRKAKGTKQASHYLYELPKVGGEVFHKNGL